MTRNQVDGLPAAAVLAALLLALLALAERAGLPLAYVRWFLVAAALLTYAALVSLSRTGRERLFIGLEGWRGPAQAGLAVAAAAWLTGEWLSLIQSPAAWMAAATGAPLGVAAAHAVERAAARSDPAGEKEPAGWPGLLAALAAAATGALVLAAGLEAGHRELARILGLGDGAALALVAMLILLPILLGGAQGALSLAKAAAVAAAIILIGLAAIGVGGLGAPPLPGQSEARTLQAIAEARERWRIHEPIHLLAWPAMGSLLGREGLTAFAAAFSAAASLSLAAAPAATLRRRATAATAVLALALLPALTTAIAGYAVEAAGTRFVGSSAARPAPVLVEASALGLVRVCGAQPETAEALRAACGVAPRDPTTLDWDRLTLSPAFLRSGLPTALGFSSTISLAADCLRLAIALAAGALGLWIAARAIGRGLLGRRRQAAGLASLRQGLIRIAALAVTGATAGFVASRLVLPPETIHALPVAAAILAAARLWSARRRAPAPDPVLLPPPRRVARTSAQGEAA